MSGVVKENISKLLPRAVTSIREGYKKAMKNVLEDLVDDIVNEEPKIPVHTGTLASSGSLFVDNIFVRVVSHKGGTPVVISSFRNNSSVKSQTVGSVVFSAPYALTVHTPRGVKFRRPGAGPLFVTEKLERNAQKYKKRLAEGWNIGARNR